MATMDKCSIQDRCGNQAAMVKRTAFPTFDGRQKKCPKFTRTFKELIKARGQGPVLEKATLSNNIPAEASQSMGEVE